MRSAFVLPLAVVGLVAVRSAAVRSSVVRDRLPPHAPRAQPVPPPTPLTSLEGQVRRFRARWWELGPARSSGDLEHARVLEVVARSLRSGAALTGALAEAVTELPRSAAVDDLECALATIRAGAPVVDALEGWRTASADRPRVMAGTALALGAELGGVPARSLDAAASGLRDRAALAREVRALSSQARASAAVMVLGPPIFLGAASAAEHRLFEVLFGSPAGLLCLVAGAALDAAGAWWMAALVRGAT